MSTLSDLGIRLRDMRPGEHRAACPACAGTKSRPRDDALALRLDSQGGATWLCHRCGLRGGWRPERVDRLSWRGREARWTPRRPERQPVMTDALPRALALWRASQPIEADDVAARYLEARRCALPVDGASLRWHPALRHPSGHVGPALVALAVDWASGAPRTLHRTWIGPGGAKAQIERPRLLWPGLPKAGAVVHLCDPAEITGGIGLAEGIETALALARAFGPAVVATIDAGNMGSLAPMAGIEAATVAVDHDPAGERAAHALADRWSRAGIEMRLWRPAQPGADIADLARGVAP